MAISEATQPAKSGEEAGVFCEIPAVAPVREEPGAIGVACGHW